MTVTYPGFKLANLQLMPILGKVLEGIGQQMSGTNAAYGGNVQLPSYIGATATAQQNQSALNASGLQQIVTFMDRSQGVTTAGAVQLIATQARMNAITATATAQGFQVWPTGVVTPGQAQIAACAAHWSTWGPARLREYWRQANAYTASVNGQVAQANTLDQQIAGALIKVMTDTLGGFLQKKINGDTGPGSVPTTSVPGTLPGTVLPPATTLPAVPAATVPAFTGTSGLAGVSTLGAGAPAPGGAGAPGVTGAVSLAGGAAGAAGVPGVGGPVAGAAAGARAGAVGMMPMGGMGGSGGAGGRQDRTASTWLNEDDDPWGGVDDVPDGVLA